MGESVYKLIDKREPPSIRRFLKRSVGLDLVKGLAITLKILLTPKKIVTVKYPMEKIPVSPRYRAVHNLMRLLDSGHERCIGCGLCEKICVANCIKIETGYGEDGRKSIRSYTINFGRCIYCGLCAEVCPELAIVHGTNYENTCQQRASFKPKEDLLTPIDAAINFTQREYEGFGSISKELKVKPTPMEYQC